MQSYSRGPQRRMFSSLQVLMTMRTSLPHTAIQVNVSSHAGWIETLDGLYDRAGTMRTGKRCSNVQIV